LRGALTLDRLDLRPLMGDGTARGAAGQAGARGWSTETMDLTGLRAFDADFTLSAGSIVTPTVNMGDSQVALRIVNGLLTANLTRMALYGGRGTALLEIDARGNVPTIRNRVEFDAIEALAFLTDAAGFDRLEGLGRLNWDVTTRGRSQRDWASAINGTGALTFNDGAIRGINFPQLVRDVQAFATGQAIERSQQKTDFTELGGTFRITNGVLENSDMRLVGPLLRMIGQGRVNLAERTLDYRLRPQFVATLEGQGATRDVTGRAVPVRVTGSWDDLRFAPDVEDIGRSVIDRLLRPREERQDEQTDSQEDEEEERTRPEDLLRRLFGGD
jgi:AsmA protein